MSDTWTDRQAVRNRHGRTQWDHFAPHRRHVTRLLLDDAPAGGTLLLLGAGNSNDVDLRQLLTRFSRVQLIDVDGDALEFGVRQQSLWGDPRLVLQVADVTGLISICSEWSGKSISQEGFDRALYTARVHSPLRDAATFSVVGSVGLLSQLIEMVTGSCPAGYPRLMELLAAVRLRHCEIMLDAARLGGRVVLTTEMVSSDTCPELSTFLAAPAPAALSLKNLLQAQIHARNFFTGLNPAVLEDLWRRAPTLRQRVREVRMIPPWLWDFGPRIYACYGVSGIRADAETTSVT